MPPKSSPQRKGKMPAKEEFAGRIDRALKHRLYLIDQRSDLPGRNELAHEYIVLGTTGSAYTVQIQPEPEDACKCTCMDFIMRRHHCKHILFILLRVLKASQSTLVDARGREKRRFTRSMLSGIYEHAPARVSTTVQATTDVVDRYFELSGEQKGHSDNFAETVPRRNWVGEDCPICFEEFEEGDEASLTWCRYGCGNSVHSDCFEKWARSQRNLTGDVACVFCRAKWEKTVQKRKRVYQVADANHRVPKKRKSQAKAKKPTSKAGKATTNDTSTAGNSSSSSEPTANSRRREAPTRRRKTADSSATRKLRPRKK